MIELVKKLMDDGVICVNTKKWFRFASGKDSPIYCDNRKILSSVEIRKYVKELLINSIVSNFNDVEVIAGVSTSGIPFGMMIADALNLPFVYVRLESKAHGLRKKIEGSLKEGQKVVVIEDLITTGNSSHQVVNILKEAGADVLGVQAIFTYLFDESIELFDNSGVKLVTMIDFASLVEYLKGIETDIDVKFLTDWHQRVNENNKIFQNYEHKHR